MKLVSKRMVHTKLVVTNEPYGCFTVITKLVHTLMSRMKDPGLTLIGKVKIILVFDVD